MTRIFTAGDYLVDDVADLFVAALATGDNEPTKQTIVADSTVDAETISFPVDGTISHKLYDGQILRFPDGATARLTADAEIGVSTLSVVISGTITTGATATPYVLLPVYAVQTFNPKTSEKTFNPITFNSNAAEEELILNRKYEISCKSMAMVAAINPGLAVLRTASRKIKSEAQVYFEFVDPDNEGYKGFANVKGWNEPREPQKERMYDWSFGVSGSLYNLDETIPIV